MGLRHSIVHAVDQITCNKLFAGSPHFQWWKNYCSGSVSGFRSFANNEDGRKRNSLRFAACTARTLGTSRRQRSQAFRL